MHHDVLLDALGDATRRSIVQILRERPHAVGEIAARLPVSQPAVSQHLGVLRAAGLVEVEKQGRRRIYRLRPEGIEPLRAYTASFWQGALEAFRASFDEPDDEEGKKP